MEPKRPPSKESQWEAFSGNPLDRILCFYAKPKLIQCPWLGIALFNLCNSGRIYAYPNSQAQDFCFKLALQKFHFIFITYWNIQNPLDTRHRLLPRIRKHRHMTGRPTPALHFYVQRRRIRIRIIGIDIGAKENESEGQGYNISIPTYQV